MSRRQETRLPFRRSVAQLYRGGAPSLPNVFGMSNLSTSNFYRGAGGAPPLGGATSSYGFVIRIDDLTFGNGPVFGRSDVNGNGGWTFQFLGEGVVLFRYVDSTGAVLDVGHTFDASDVGKLHTILGVIDGSGTSQLYTNASLDGTTPGGSGYRNPTASVRLTIGRFPTLNLAPTNITFVGGAVSSTTDESANVAAWHAACRNEGTCALFPGTTQARWRAADAQGSPASWVDTELGTVISRSGSPVVTEFAPDWKV